MSTTYTQLQIHLCFMFSRYFIPLFFCCFVFGAKNVCTFFLCCVRFFMCNINLKSIRCDNDQIKKFNQFQFETYRDFRMNSLSLSQDSIYSVRFVCITSFYCCCCLPIFSSHFISIFVYYMFCCMLAVPGLQARFVC